MTAKIANPGDIHSNLNLFITIIEHIKTAKYFCNYKNGLHGNAAYEGRQQFYETHSWFLKNIRDMHRLPGAFFCGIKKGAVELLLYYYS